MHWHVYRTKGSYGKAWEPEIRTREASREAFVLFAESSSLRNNVDVLQRTGFHSKLLLVTCCVTHIVDEQKYKEFEWLWTRRLVLF